jgi:iron complex outermembrane receptor protein
MFDTYLDYEINTPLPGPVTMYALTSVTGNKNLSLLNSNLLEFGYRTMLAGNISIDLETYYTRTNDYSLLVQHATTPTPENYPTVAYTELVIENIPLYVDQIGATMSANAVFGKLQLKPFITLQRTTLKDYSPYYSTADAAPMPENGYDPATNNLNSGMGVEQDHKFTPKAYGGAYINYAINDKLGINLNTYWFSQQTFLEQSNLSANDGVTGVEHVKGKALVNAKVTYKPLKSLSIFISGRNLLGQKSVEHYRSDYTERMFLGGVSFDF